MARRDRERRSFAGRLGELKLLGNILEDPNIWLINIHGVPGIGKSMLLSEACKGLSGAHPDWLVLRLDTNATSDALRALDEVVAQALHVLGESGLSQFREAKATYGRVRDKLRDAFAPGSVSPDEQAEIADRVLDPEEKLYFRNPLKPLTDHFLSDLEASGLDVVVAVDAYEKASTALTRWLEHLTELDTIKLILSGQERLASGWIALAADRYREVGLEQMTKADIVDWIRAAGLDDHDELVAILIRETDGVPLTLAIHLNLLQHGHDIDDAQRREVADADFVSRVLDAAGSTEIRELVLAGAGFIEMDRRSLEIAVGHPIFDTSWLEFRDLPFVLATRNNRYRFHDLVQSALFREGVRRGYGVQRETHLKVASYWKEANKPGFALYHTFLADEEEGYFAGTELFDVLNADANIAHAESIVDLFTSASRTLEVLERIALCVRGLLLRAQGRWGDLAAIEGATHSNTRTQAQEYPPLAMVVSYGQRYLGRLLAATKTVEAGLASIRSGGFNSGFRRLSIELSNQLIELLGLRGLHDGASDVLLLLQRNTASSSDALRIATHFQTEHLARWRGKWDVAMVSLAAVAKLLESASADRIVRARLAYGAGRLLTYMGFLQAASLLLDQAEREFNLFRRPQAVGEVLVGRAIIARELEDIDRSQELLDEADGLFQSGASRLYEAWVLANRLRALAARGGSDEPGIVRATELHDEFEAMQYRHGQGHVLFYLDAVGGESLSRAATHFKKYDMRFEALEAEIALGGTSTEGVRGCRAAAMAGFDFLLLASVAGRRRDWQEFDHEWGPHIAGQRFDKDRIGAFKGFGPDGYQSGTVMAEKAHELFHAIAN